MIAEGQTHAQESGHEFGMPSTAVLRGSASLRQLRDRVQAIVKELDRLQEENKKLSNRIAELESARIPQSDRTHLTFNKDKEALLSQINTFIKTIDNYLAFEQEATN